MSRKSLSLMKTARSRTGTHQLELLTCLPLQKLVHKKQTSAQVEGLYTADCVDLYKRFWEKQ